jgi:ribonuclease HI
MMIYHIHTDGGSRGNPGPGAIGVVIDEVEISVSHTLPENFGSEHKTIQGQRALSLPSNQITQAQLIYYASVLHSPDRKKFSSRRIASYGRYIGHSTNNIAEYQAVESACAFLTSNTVIHSSARGIIFCADSKLLVMQINGKFKIKNDVIKQKIFAISTQLRTIKLPYVFMHVAREVNTDADIRVNQSLDMKCDVGTAHVV